MIEKKDVQPSQIAAAVEERYRQYLRTTFYFKDSDLRNSFEEALQSGHLSRGPFLESTPVFKRGKTIKELAKEIGFDNLDNGFVSALYGGALYTHQEQAIRSVAKHKNIIVATGTGSGKTEAFLYPILLHLYREFESGLLNSGVRALILYPMNALANDQRERLGGICEKLSNAKSPFRFTFGQYIGETPEDEADTRRNAQDFIRNRKPGELVLRSEMRKSPPHILLTNYSMLEYLLLRPQDSELFDNGNAAAWKFLVLDEAHQYRGAQGIEMAMLLRRLKQRVREGGRSGEFTCIATSASLVGEEGDKKKVTQFASDLFGETFQETHLVVGESDQIKSPSNVSLSCNEYELLERALSNAEDSACLLKLEAKVNVQSEPSEQIRLRIARILESDQRSSELRQLITGSPKDITFIANAIFKDAPEAERIRFLSNLVGLLMTVRSPDSDAPLLSTRYHLFVRSLEGAFVSYWPQKEVSLERKDNLKDRKFFEVALCRECGQHYFVGRENDGSFGEAVRDPGLSDFGVTYLRPTEGDNQVEDDELFEENQKVYLLCVQCGSIGLRKLKCNHNNNISVVREAAPKDSNRADQIQRCGACGFSAAGRDPVREVVHGTDGPHAVIATTLHELLPNKRKKVLAFADGRQEAAFFAWYLQDSYKDILNRSLLLRSLRSLTKISDEGFSLSEAASSLHNEYKNEHILPASTGNVEYRNYVWLQLYRELLTIEPRISLEGVGLIKWHYKWPDHICVPDILRQPPWSLSPNEATDLVWLLLDSMRERFALEIVTASDVTLNWSDIFDQRIQMQLSLGLPGGRFGLASWDGKSGRRFRFLMKILTKKGINEDSASEIALQTLRAIWGTIRKADDTARSCDDHLLVQSSNGCRLNPRWYRLQLAEHGKIFQCSACNRLQSLSVFGVCKRPNCRGTLKEVMSDQLVPNHYRILYESNLPSELRVEEHTAQLDKEKAREFQRQFKDGRIHILSCSTTFELGVDLGDLNTIFLRNIPPEAFNYAQRVGRAGRRVGFPGFAVTYCKRGPHDLYHFFEPERMMSGKSRPPIISLRNEKIVTRHIAAMVLSAFFRENPERFSRVEGLLRNMAESSATIDLKSFLISHRVNLENSLTKTFPLETWAKVGLTNGDWIERIAGTYKDDDGQDRESRFLLAEEEVVSDYNNVVQLMVKSKNSNQFQAAEWAKRRADTISSENVLSFLSRKAIIPKYGFPVDVVELDPQRIKHGHESSQVSLQRDLGIAISEFAPTNQLIANKKKWVSYGLKKVAEKEWPQMYYKRCPKHGVFLEWNKGEPEPPTPCEDKLAVVKYIIPQFGFITNREKPQDPTGRPNRFFSTRPYFAHSLRADPGIMQFPANVPLITVQKASPGLMVILCEGRRGGGFYICPQCGAGFNKRTKEHSTPFGQQCTGMPEHAALGHSFVTDVLKLRFHPRPQDDIDVVWFAQSLAYAIVEGAAETLEVPTNDLNVTVSHASTSQVPEIIVYDNVPGGAGLVARLEEESTLKQCLSMTLDRVNGKCGCETSCYGCLRNYRNQFVHQNLRRLPVKGYLETLLMNWR